MSRLSIWTWNVWFDHFAKNERYDEILNLCRVAAYPDVICFQEVTPHFVNKIKEHRLSDYYEVSDSKLNGATVESYGVLTLCRRELNPVFHWHLLPTDMGRKLLITTFSTTVGLLNVGNVHLESLDSAPTRFSQLELCNKALNRSGAVSFLCGDFNFDSDRNFHMDSSPLENDNLASTLPMYKDVWQELHPPGSGKTYDTELNWMLSGRKERMRYDRIMLRDRPIPLADKMFKLFGKSLPSKPICEPLEIRLLGTTPVGQNLNSALGDTHDYDNQANNSAQSNYGETNRFLTPEKETRSIFPSDHFGLHAVFKLNA